MARAPKAGADKGDPPTADLGIAHDHGDGDKNHLHRLGDVPHLHDEHGKAVLLNEHGEPLFDTSENDAKLDALERQDPAPPTGFGVDEWGTDPATGEYHAPPDPAPGGHHSDSFNGEAQEKAAKRRAEIVASVTDDDIAEMEQIRRDRTDAILPPGGQPRSDASEAMLAAGMGVLVPAAHQDFAITHAEESARVVVMVQTVGRMLRSIGDGQLTDAKDLRTVYLKVRQIAATHGIDLEDGGA